MFIHKHIVIKFNGIQIIMRSKNERIEVKENKDADEGADKKHEKSNKLLSWNSTQRKSN